tara:strand:+ start:178 stop:2883 length:2706 start_codon:yes stop_codon:yes gene_type:complete
MEIMMRIIRSIILAMTLMSAVAHGGDQVKRSANDASIGQVKSPEEVVAGFDQRVEQMFRAESGKPLVRAAKRKPLGPGRGNYVRYYSWSMMAFATRCFYLGEMLDEANAALAENAQHYLDHPKDINDRDSFHWHAETVLRLIEMYGTHGTMHPGRITPETEALILKPHFAYVKQYSLPDRAETEQSQSWHIYESENHHAMSFTLSWHFAKIAQNLPEYREVKYHGLTPAQHYQMWNEYFVVYCRERARKGLFVEMMSHGYNSTLIKGIYNFYDFGEPAVHRSAEMLLDLYFAYWAQEQIDGVQGGGRSRIYFLSGLSHNPHHGMAPLAWFYFGIGEQPAVNGHDINAALSAYRPPAMLADIAMDVEGRGSYEVRQRPQGLGRSGNMNPYRMNLKEGGILRYTYCDPSFILGTPMVLPRPNEQWAKISSQNRWQGAIFAGAPGARIVPTVRPKDNRVVFNAFYSLQSKGTLITQKIKDRTDGAEMIVWISDEGLSQPVEEDGIVFVEAKGAYAAIRVVKGGFELTKDKFKTIRSVPKNSTMILNDEYAPVILEVMAKSDVTGFDQFKAKVKACELKMDGTTLIYPTIYGEALAFDTSGQKTPAINGKAVNYAPQQAFESPFLNADYNSGVVTISKGNRKKVLDFTMILGELKKVAPELTACLNGTQQAFKQASAGNWRDVFSDEGTGDWKENWFLDGEVGRVSTGPDGMSLTAGPQFKDDSHHMVLWTKDSFNGDLKIEYEYTRLDSETRCVNILYIQATGSGKEPYAADISKWNDLRKVPSMKTYYNHMNAYHISYSANPGTSEQYIRGRRYMPNRTGLKGTNLKPDYYPKGLFASGVPHEITVIKKDRDIFMRIKNPEQTYYCHMTNPDLPIVTQGRIGLRHMFTRSARYKNFRISTSAN